MKAVQGYIERKSMLYLTGVEYGDYTMNHVLGCAHGCKYPCYAFMLKRRFGQVSSYEDWLKPFLVSNTLEILDKEIPRLKSKIQSVQLCFTTDPFMYGYEEIEKMSRSAIQKLNDAGIKCTVLSKGILPVELATYSKENEYGITLVSLDEDYRANMEPGAAPYGIRLAALKALHDKGCFTGSIILGRTNYSKEITAFKGHREFYNEQAEKVTHFCKEQGIKFHIKDGTIT